MDGEVLNVNELRILVGLIGALLLLLIYKFGQPKKPGQGKRTLLNRNGERIDPIIGTGTTEIEATLKEDAIDSANELHEAASSGASKREPSIGARPERDIERIVTLFVAARSGDTIAGSDLAVAAEKAGLQFGDKGIFHRLVTGKPEAGPVFSVANMVKPGYFDMREVDTLRTPGVTFFMILPGPLSALDAWEAMLPCAQRLAELLDANLLDEERNALGRQRIAHIRDELRAYDRKYEREQIKSSW